ncbi:MAG: caspase family protein [Candidatus Eremiobacteraeota bacterium]|nr:caspase family protein [Candidatus Eremiobacteraeota bacterium]
MMKKRTRHLAAPMFLVMLLASCLILSGCGGGSGDSGGGYYYGGGGGTVTNPPVVTSVANSQGGTSLASGNECVISGTDFGSTRGLRADTTRSKVTFMSTTIGGSSVDAAVYNSWSTTQIKCIVPDLTIGQKYVVVVTIVTGGESINSSITESTANTITAIAQSAPIITALSPNAATVGTTTTLTITGNYFGTTQGSVTFQKGTETPITVSTFSQWTNTYLVLTSPSSLVQGTYNVTVTNVTGTSSASSFQVLPSGSPLITSISPSSIAQSSTSTVILTGSGFGAAQGTGYVSFQRGTETPVTVTTGLSWADTQISCPVPAAIAATASTVNVSLMNGSSLPSNSVPLTIGSSGPGKVYALFVGINDYPTSPLNWCVNDVNGLKGCLTTSALWSGASMTTLSNSAATKSAIQNAISTMASQVTASDMFLMYYSGHGSNSGGGTYIVPIDFEGQASRCISATELNTWVSAVNTSAKKVIIFDSCYSGGFIGKGKGAMKSRYIALPGSAENFQGKDLARQLESISNLVFLAASRGSQTSLESSGLEHGVFTYYLMEGLGNGTTIGPAAATGGSSISASQAFNYASPKVQLYVDDGSQTPQLQNNYSGSLIIKQ